MSDDDALKDELSSLMGELKQEMTGSPVTEEVKSGPGEQTSAKGWRGEPHVPRRVNRLKPGGRLIFKKRNVIGVDIGSYSVKVVQVDTTVSPPLLYGFAFEEIPQEQRDKGKKTEEYVIDILKNIIREKRLVDSISVSYLSGPGVFVFSGLIDKVPVNEILDTLRPQLEEKITFPLEEAFLKHSVTGEVAGRGGEKLEVLAVAAKKETVQKTVWLVEESGLQISGLSTPAHSFENLFSLKKGAVPPNIVIINLGAKRTEINYYRDGRFVTNREVSVGSSDMNKMMAVKISTDDGQNITITQDEAESIKREFGVISNPQSVRSDPVLNRVVGLARPALEKIVAELKRSLAFFQRSANVQKMDKVYIVGGGANIPRLIPFLKQELMVDVEAFPVQKYFQFEKKLFESGEDEQMLNALIPACGLFLDADQRSLNLVPAQTLIFSRFASYKHIWNLIVGGVFAAMLLSYGWFFTQDREIARQLSDSQDQLALLDSQSKAIDALLAFKTSYLEKKKLVESLVLLTPNWNGLFYEMSRIVPKGIQLDAIDVEIVEGEGVMTIRGTIDTRKTRLDKSISLLMDKMGSSPFFKGVELVKMEQNPASKDQLAQFEVKGSLFYS